MYYLTTTKDKKKEKETKDGEYLITYTRHLEKRLRNLETEKQLLDAERLRLEQELHSLRNEIDRLREPPLVSATIIDILDENKGKAIVKSSTGPSFVVNASRKVKNEKLKTGMRVALNQRTFAIMELLPTKLDPFVKGMEVIDSIPDTSYNDVGGLEEQLMEVRETVELPLKRPELFKKVGIDPPKGVLLYGPPGTGKTLVAKAVAHETEASFIRIIGSELVQKFIGEGARLVREVFNLAKKKAPSILFIDELDAIGSQRLKIATSGDREVQRTLMQLLSELDGFEARGDVKIIGATNRVDILDPALLRPGRFDRMIEFPIPSEEARKVIFNIHTRELNVSDDVNIKRFVKITDGATGADIKAICTEAGMFAIRKTTEVITQEDFLEAITKVLNKNKSKCIESKLYS
ncbi:MAG: proteasome-activating nucleotidase [Candidatus Lokiarchaeota archaeon]|nr:proteasome-activating nucleotidase [Candidatus Lokiarchaeota archaeon]MBD3198883.1 proteasome-activating nucleotidase [Candidatus Lokiarchaeota archaeon]